MRSINKVILIGNLTRDPEMRQTPNGQYVTTFGLATNREWVTTEGTKHSLAEFHECVAWSKLAEICNNYLKKGKLVYVEGYLKTRSWDTPEGIKKFKTEVILHDMIMLEKRPKKEGEEEEYIPEEEVSPVEEEEKAEEKPKQEVKKEEKAEKKAEEKPAPEEKPEEKKEEKPKEAKLNVDIEKDLGL